MRCCFNCSGIHLVLWVVKIEWSVSWCDIPPKDLEILVKLVRVMLQLGYPGDSWSTVVISEIREPKIKPPRPLLCSVLPQQFNSRRYCVGIELQNNHGFNWRRCCFASATRAGVGALSDVWNYKFTELLRLENTFKIIKSNHQPSTTTFITKLYPQVFFNIHRFFNIPGMVTPPPLWAAHSNALQLLL